MPTLIRPTTMPGKIQRGRICDALVLDLFGPSLGHEDITIRTAAEVAPAVRAFGERIYAAHPDASFMINVTVQKGQRKPPGFDAAERADDFKPRAFMHVEVDDSQTVRAPALAKAGS